MSEATKVDNMPFKTIVRLPRIIVSFVCLIKLKSGRQRAVIHSKVTSVVFARPAIFTSWNASMGPMLHHTFTITEYLDIQRKKCKESVSRKV